MMKRIPTFEDEHGNRIVFVRDPRNNITYRVEVNNVMVGFLDRHHQPTPVVAEFFRNKFHDLGGVG
jgi:hypothetical protein